ncbi:MAG: AAA domain-containing protein [Candidatus Parabeggiatoa sp.]|nr:AAA domain-containing protein [Candidatus Parabeggiatoa sp.]
MALLHYQNVEEDIHRPDILMLKTVDGLKDFYSYLDRTKRYLESDEAVLRLAWKPSSPKYVVSWKKSGNRPGDKGFWIKLTAIEGSEAPKACEQAFFDSEMKWVRQAESVQMTEITLPEEKLQILDRRPQENRLCLEQKPDFPLLLLDDIKGCWVELTEAEDRPEEPDTTFQAFLDENTKSVYQAEALEKKGTEKSKRWTFSQNEALSILDRDIEANQLLLKKQPDKPMLLLKPNTYQLQKQLEAIRSLQDSPWPEHRPLLRLMESTDHAQWPNLPITHIADWWRQSNWDKDNTQFSWKLLTDLSLPGTDKQRDFVHIALNTPDFAFLEGPPGSGKTTAICELILQLIAQDKRVLLCASTHVAVDNVIERLMDKDNEYREQVIPVRIGDKSNLSDSVKDYQFEAFRDTEKKRLVKFLSQQNPPNEAQKHLLQAIQGENETLTNMILDCANVVCGTTIGILQHPQIKNRSMANPLFDMLIIDEASKTQFQEFLVPALLAKRWILIGDPRQLSPYVDDEAMAENVKVCLPDPVSREVCWDVFQAMHYPNSGAVLVATDEASLLEKYQRQAAAHQDKVLFANAQSDAMSLACASIVADTPNNLATCEAALPLDITTLRGKTENLHLLKRRVAAWQSQKQPAEEKNWANEVAWRQARLYEQRQSQGKQGERLQHQINDLLPAQEVVEKPERVQMDIERVRRIALPSVLESLQNGFERSKRQRTGTALSDGLPKEVLKQRHVLLEYQHRMHPEISQFSRTHIYQGEALQDPPDMEELRKWDYERYAHRAVWLDVWPKKGEQGNRNSREVAEIKKEIKAFHQWAKQNPHPKNQVWTVAVLSFYLGQEKLLREACRKLSGQHRASRNFYLGGNKQKHDVHLEVCTVDRFQGHEADLVFLSFVKNHATVFLGSPNRLNVAVTRARYQLVLVGNPKRLSNERYTELQALLKTVPVNHTWSES